MKYGALIRAAAWGGALWSGVLAGCQQSRDTLPLIVDGDTVRLLASTTGCPSDAVDSSFDDSTWMLGVLPLKSVPSSGVCLRKQFNVGAQLPEYRWLQITLTSGAQAQLNAGSSKAVTSSEEHGLAWQTGVGALTGVVQETSIVAQYTLDLQLFPQLLQPENNVLALHVPSTAQPLGQPVEVHATLQKDHGSSSNYPTLVDGPYLVHPTPTSVQIEWETSVAAPSWARVNGVFYDGGWAVHHSANVDNLTPGQSYTIMVSPNQTDTPPPECEMALQTDVQLDALRLGVRPAPDDSNLGGYVQRNGLCAQFSNAYAQMTTDLHEANGSSLHLVMVGDTRSSPATTAGVLAQVGQENPELIVHTGDLVQGTEEANWQAFFTAARAMTARAPVAPVIGERDFQPWADRFGQLFAVDGSGPAGHSYAVDAKAVHVALVDSMAEPAQQAAWLDADLTQATNDGAQQLLVVTHRGPWAASANAADAAAGAALLPVLQAHGVKAIFSGHANVYEHGVVGGVHYFVSGGAGPQLDTTAAAGPNTITLQAIAHYLTVDADARGVTVTAKDLTHTPFDIVTL